MKEPLAFRAAYSDWKLIKTRGVVQVVLEVPLADADAAYNVLGGMPDASREVWFAVAPLKLPPAEKESSPPATPQPATDKPPAAVKREKMDWRDVQPAAQSAIRCQDPIFVAFLKEQHEPYWETYGDAARVVRSICEVKSRIELNTVHPCRMLWKQLDDHFQAWKLKDRVGV